MELTQQGYNYIGTNTFYDQRSLRAQNQISSEILCVVSMKGCRCVQDFRV